ncbi:hypothetical protein PIB30_024435 [Stylosanthes scabra]|uniref:Uncharacterized protein n=1 Tax=Stylosanthes scabra TaxID=79078 RepID=A0ABU6VC15_9FABA|nr:hypothetical protein [Stylosanthes scabra]
MNNTICGRIGQSRHSTIRVIEDLQHWKGSSSPRTERNDSGGEPRTGERRLRSGRLAGTPKAGFGASDDTAPADDGVGLGLWVDGDGWLGLRRAGAVASVCVFFVRSENRESE